MNIQSRLGQIQKAVEDKYYEPSHFVPLNPWTSVAERLSRTSTLELRQYGQVESIKNKLCPLIIVVGTLFLLWKKFRA